MATMDYIDDIATTLDPDADNSSARSATLKLYDIFIPLLGLFIISLNLLVVISSGLLLKKRKLAHFAPLLFVFPSMSPISICFVVIKANYRQWCSYSAIKQEAR